ncbi:hypothetical protein PFICI_08737 [Pestalotiopsis fici W106-1]|uniref:peptidyl-tRNA hydrolase n=1 Tax=Pestalotiopsis fici (strain W106-1 / CGMCC3.15140) TaxID=1229662 RepID=W3WYM8_PESFW|nr:uncharacterized protein PFICI_08737 [Pestalotiopsis fici W106-1]ETS78884.1 hypothetical protein PFICI_08737 [Pestalotiopsis fici W106-1]
MANANISVGGQQNLNLEPAILEGADAHQNTTLGNSKNQIAESATTESAQISKRTTLETKAPVDLPLSAAAHPDPPSLLPLSPPLSPERNARAAMSSTRLFIASLGNPAPYQSSRHSAGHVLLRALQSHLQLPALKKSKPYANGLVSMGADVGRPEYTLWQSPSYMNVSGKDLLKAYKQFIAESRSFGGDFGLPGLVVLHDEMETAPGQLRPRNGNLSAKGHNGIKSVQQSLQSAGLMAKLTEPGAGGKFIKVGIGIGRPAGGSREKDVVSAYVLGNFTGSEHANLVGSTSNLVTILEDARMSMSN